MMEVKNYITMDDENIEKFKQLYGKNIVYGEKTEFDNEVPVLFTLSMITPNREEWGSDSDAFDDMGEQFYCGLTDMLKGEFDFRTANQPPLKLYEKMASDGLVFEISWEADNLDETGIGKGLVIDGHFLYGVDFEATLAEMRSLEAEGLREYCEFNPLNYGIFHVDALGNRCELDDEGDRIYVVGYGCTDVVTRAYPVKKMLECEDSDLESLIEEMDEQRNSLIFKVPSFFEDNYNVCGYEIDEFSDDLRCDGSFGEKLYLLDKDGERIKCIKDFDHSEPDAEGNVYYPVPDDDLEDGQWTESAKQKWRAKLGL